MEYIRLNEYASTGLSIFTNLEKLNPSCKIFELGKGVYWDAYFWMRYHTRIASDYLVSNGLDDIVSVINCLFTDKWNRVYDFNVYTFNALSNGGKVVETLEQTDSKGTTQETTGKVSPFNDDDFANRDAETVVNSGADVTEYTKTTIDDRLYNYNLQKFVDYLSDNGYYDIIMADVLALVALNIY